MQSRTRCKSCDTIYRVKILGRKRAICSKCGGVLEAFTPPKRVKNTPVSCMYQCLQRRCMNVFEGVDATYCPVCKGEIGVYDTSGWVSPAVGREFSDTPFPSDGSDSYFHPDHDPDARRWRSFGEVFFGWDNNKSHVAPSPKRGFRNKLKL